MFSAIELLALAILLTLAFFGTLYFVVFAAVKAGSLAAHEEARRSSPQTD
ncbi:hypothetical protein [Nocardioides silvaticus]|nr:hypothetical protein [Nocardioides silvaticus]